MENNKKQFPTQIGQSITCDFREHTWTFEMSKGFAWTGGKFAIVPSQEHERLKRIEHNANNITAIEETNAKGLLEALEQIVLYKHWMPAQAQQSVKYAIEEIRKAKEVTNGK